MRKLQLLNFFMAASVILLLSDCELFGDEEHCQNQTVESKIWTPSSYPALAPRDTAVSFVFNRDANLKARSFQIKNVCPFGVIGFKVKIKERISLSAPRPNYYKALLVEYVGKGGYAGGYKIRKIIYIYRISQNELQGEGTYEMGGLLEQGGRDFFVGCAAIFAKSVFSDLFALETWAKDNISSVEFSANFIKWE